MARDHTIVTSHQCGKSYSQNNHLKKHLRAHRGEIICMVVIVKKLFQQMLILHPTLEYTLGRNHISALNVAKLSHIVAHLYSIQ